MSNCGHRAVCSTYQYPCPHVLTWSVVPQRVLHVDVQSLTCGAFAARTILCGLLCLCDLATVGTGPSVLGSRDEGSLRNSRAVVLQVASCLEVTLQSQVLHGSGDTAPCSVGLSRPVHAKNRVVCVTHCQSLFLLLTIRYDAARAFPLRPPRGAGPGCSTQTWCR